MFAVDKKYPDLCLSAALLNSQLKANRIIGNPSGYLNFKLCWPITPLNTILMHTHINLDIKTNST